MEPVHEPVLEWADQSLVPVVDHQQRVVGRILRLVHHLLHELGLLHRERVMSSRSGPRRWRSLPHPNRQKLQEELPDSRGPEPALVCRAPIDQHLLLVQPELRSLRLRFWAAIRPDGGERHCRSRIQFSPRPRSKIRADRLIAKMATERSDRSCSYDL